MNGDIPFRAVQFSLSLCAYYLALGLCACSPLQQKEASLMMGEQVNDLWKLRVFLIIFYRKNILWYLLKDEG